MSKIARAMVFETSGVVVTFVLDTETGLIDVYDITPGKSPTVIEFINGARSTPELKHRRVTAERLLNMGLDHDAWSEVAGEMLADAEENEVAKNNRPETEAGAQAKLHGKDFTKGQTSQDQPYEGFGLGDQSGRRAGAGNAGEGSNRSDREQ